MRDLNGARILITGASSGIGLAMARSLALKGARVLATARRADRLDQLRDSFQAIESKLANHGSIESRAGDITDPHHRTNLIDFCQANWGGLDGLVNNAGAGAIGPFAEASPDRLRKVMEVDFFASVELTRIAIPLLRSGRQPFIALIGSVLSHRGVSRKSEYCAAKFALRGWSESLRCELKQDKIDVVMISPSTTRSDFFESLLETAPSEKSRSLGSMTPEAVAEQAIRAIQRNRREAVLSLGGKALVWCSKWLPGLLDRWC